MNRRNLEARLAALEAPPLGQALVLATARVRAGDATLADLALSLAEAARRLASDLAAIDTADGYVDATNPDSLNNPNNQGQD
jgi:hypothetical protein